MKRQLFAGVMLILVYQRLKIKYQKQGSSSILIFTFCILILSTLLVSWAAADIHPSEFHPSESYGEWTYGEWTVGSLLTVEHRSLVSRADIRRFAIDDCRLPIENRKLKIENCVGQAFVHPGLLHNRADLAFIKQKVASGEEPWKAAWDKMRSAWIASLDWTASPVADVVRGAYNDPDIGSSNLSHDSAAAYCHALQWVVTGDKAHAKKAMEIIKVWSATLKSIQGHDQKLLAGFTGHKFCNAAEILRYTESGWSSENIEQFKNMLMMVYYPLIKDFFPKANGNWDAAMVNTMLCIGVFCDNQEIFNRAVNHFLHGQSNGAITHYIFPTGQCQESTRDQAHTQLGLGMLAAACEVAWKQGVDLYGAADNRLAVGYEYTAKYNLEYDVPCEGKISAQARGRFQPIYEVVYQHYVYEKGLKMPYTKMVIDKIRPESGGGEHLSWGTLTFYKGPGRQPPTETFGGK